MCQPIKGVEVGSIAQCRCNFVLGVVVLLGAGGIERWRCALDSELQTKIFVKMIQD